ncbi:FecR family protein [Chitinophaga silvatica]|uniref:FecR family protein n=1 Tax=Chitinophaga silvatica TaxID=2282649 RepID=A0A3E1Y2J8_9BACT|nr:FecR family protein [Chitinophaga silvatica]RFS18905.1 FecR family protein [Chitinophaga silvatica]
MNAKKLAELLQKYEDGQCSEEEQLMIDKFYQDFDADRDTLPDEIHMQPSYDSLYEKILQQKNNSAILKPAGSRSWYYAAAAAVLLCIAVGSWFWINVNDRKIIAKTPVNKSEKVKKHFIKLPDGSTVLLNERSRLQYPASFDGARREVQLWGEGYFDIVANSKQPFIVHSGNVSTTVLGTVFNIKADPNEKQVTITVEKGKVKVESAGKQLGIIESNQQIKVSQSALFERNDTIKAESITDWVKEDLIFNNVTYAEAAKVLKAQYGINIIFKDAELEKNRFTTTFKNQSSLEEILIVLCEFNQSSFSIQDSTVIIQKRNQ